MLRLVVIFFVAGILLTACTKSNNNNETVLYGVWVKGNQRGDTIVFMNEGGRHMIQFPISNITTVPGYSKLPYRYRQKKLYISFAADAEFACNSFNWKEEGKSFELQGNDLYVYMSSIAPRYTYTRVQ